jgi:hypothetical protein
MRLFSGKIPIISDEVIRVLCKDGDIEIIANEEEEARLDVESVLREYLRTEREVEDQARDLLTARGLGHTGFGRAKRQIAEDRGFGLGEDAVAWICDQILDLFMHTHHIEEIYSDDQVLRRKLADILKKHMAEDEDLDLEVKKRMRHLEEGTLAWDVEYDKVQSKIRRLKGLG